MELHKLRHEEVKALLSRSSGWRPALWGDLEGTPFPDLLNILTQGRRSGLLLVEHAGEERALGFISGDVTFAASTVQAERDEARQIVFALLREQAGTFTWLRGPHAVLGRDAPRSAQELLLDGLCRLDEEAPASGSADQHVD